jgi:hypothetical protein
MAKANKLESWINVPSVMETRYGTIEGAVKYGVRLPMRPGITPLHDCEPKSNEKIEGETPGYWFINNDETTKVKLIAQLVSQDKIRGIGYDQRYFFYTICKK